ncbi:hypothetical protein NXW46_03150 [Bacteroides fragilis]|nr:hypothetical protein NXW46_03150 [Bacteroides fragilis]
MRITKSILALMAATMTFAACSNDEKITESAPKTVALTVKLPEFGGASSRAIENETQTGHKVTVSGNNVTIIARVGQNGAITNTITKTLTPGGAGFNQEQITVSGAATWIDVEANSDNGSTETDDVNTRQGAATSSKVRLFGGAAITGAGASGATCTPTINPEMARVEIKGSLGNSWIHLNDLKVKGIYINNIKLKRGDAMNALTRIASNMPAWNAAYAVSGTFENMYNKDLGGGIQLFKVLE